MSGDGELPSAVLARIDERTKNTDSRMGRVETAIDDIKKSMGENYVSHDVFEAAKADINFLKKGFFTVAGVICLAVLTAILNLIPGLGK